MKTTVSKDNSREASVELMLSKLLKKAEEDHKYDFSNMIRNFRLQDSLKMERRRKANI